MNRTKLDFFEGSYLAGYDYFPFDEIFSSIKHLQKISSQKKKESRGILYTIIIQCTTYIEGICGQILFSTIEYKINEFEREYGTFDSTFSFDEDKEFYIRLLKSIEEKIDDSYFKDLEKNWKLIYNQNLKEQIDKRDQQLWKSIMHLFNLRNAITHGHILTIEYSPIKGKDKEYNIKTLGKYKKTYDFLSEKKLIETDSLGMVSLINENIVSFFISETKSFINAMLLSIPKNGEKYLAIDKLQNIRNLDL